MRNVEIIGYGMYLPKNKMLINNETRYRINDESENQITMAVKAANAAMDKANITIEDIDLIVATSAVGFQPIPCTAALIHEKIAKGTSIPAMDINTTCTSFVSAFDTLSYLIDAGRYKTVLLVASEQGSVGLNSNQKESYELFSDAAAAVVITKSKDRNTGILAAMQKTWSEGAHSTEIRGGLTGMFAKHYNENTHSDYCFDMKGREVLSLVAKKIPNMMNEFYNENGISLADIDLLVPHQASKALRMIMKRLNVPEGKYVDFVKEYGNMVSASIPVAFCRSIEEGKIKKGDTIMFIGTAAGLTANVLVFRY